MSVHVQVTLSKKAADILDKWFYRGEPVNKISDVTLMKIAWVAARDAEFKAYLNALLDDADGAMLSELAAK